MSPRNRMSFAALGIAVLGLALTAATLAAPLAYAASQAASQDFQDVPTSSPFYGYLHNLVTQGIVSGYTCVPGGLLDPCVPPNNLPYYHPGAAVTRLQMTKFIDMARMQPGIVINSVTNPAPFVVSTTHGTGILVHNDAGDGLVGSSSTIGNGVVGFASTSGSGVQGISGSGHGVDGESTSGYGVYGSSAGNFAGYFAGNVRVTGVLNTTILTPFAVTATHGTGILVHNDAGDGLVGSSSAIGNGVVGFASTNGAGVQGISDSGHGVDGFSTTGYGVYGSSSGNYAGYFAGDIGVTGVISTNTITPFTVTATQGIGILVYNASGDGLVGSSSAIGNGVVGFASTNGGGVLGISGSGHGVDGESTSGYGVYGTSSSNFAGYFQGDVRVTGVISGGSAGLYQIDDPLDPAHQYLNQAAVEAPDLQNVYSGNVTTDATGTATVQLPAYVQALDHDFRYQLTVIGQFAQAIIGSPVADGRFTIRTDKPSVAVSWQVTGIRNDPWATDHAAPAEVPKPPAAQGKYVYPQGYGQPASAAIGYQPPAHAPAR